MAEQQLLETHRLILNVDLQHNPHFHYVVTGKDFINCLCTYMCNEWAFSFHQDNTPPKSKISKRCICMCIALTALIIDLLLLVSWLVVYFFIISTEPALVRLDVHCKWLYGECAYYREKYVNDCLKEDFCSTTKIVVELNTVRAVSGPGFKAQLVFSTPSHRLTIPNGVPCLMPGKTDGEKDAIGLCRRGHCFLPIDNQSVTDYMMQRAIDGNWTEHEGVRTIEDIPCMDTSRLPPVMKKYLTRFHSRSCTTTADCKLAYLKFRSCTKPAPALGGSGCMQNLSHQVEQHFIPPEIHFHMNWRTCHECLNLTLERGTILDNQCSAAVTPQCNFVLKTSELGSVESHSMDDEWLLSENASELKLCCFDGFNTGACLAGTCIF